MNNNAICCWQGHNQFPSNTKQRTLWSINNSKIPTSTTLHHNASGLIHTCTCMCDQRWETTPPCICIFHTQWGKQQHRHSNIITLYSLLIAISIYEFVQAIQKTSLSTTLSLIQWIPCSITQQTRRSLTYFNKLCQLLLFLKTHIHVHRNIWNVCFEKKYYLIYWSKSINSFLNILLRTR